MCLIMVAWQSHPDYPLVMAANRDEFYERPTVKAHFWEDAPQVLAGRDLRQGGTWLGLARDGRFAAITNFRGAQSSGTGRRSRGDLIADYLLGEGNVARYLDGLEERKSLYNPFNLLVGDRRVLGYSDDAGDGWRELPPGIHVLGNDRLASDTAKERRGREALREALEGGADTDDLLRMLSDRTPAADSVDPLERGLSARFIHLPETGYGTRASTVIRIARDGRAEFVEQNYDEQGRAGDPERFTVQTGG